MNEKIICFIFLFLFLFSSCVSRTILPNNGKSTIDYREREREVVEGTANAQIIGNDIENTVGRIEQVLDGSTDKEQGVSDIIQQIRGGESRDRQPNGNTD